MKSLVPLYECLLIDASKQCCVSTLRDLETISQRVEHEGISFLTITLPNFGSDFERSLDQGFVVPNSFLGFKRTKSLPSFLKGLTGLVFDPSSGLLLDNPDPIAIFFIRQVCLYAKKIELPCTEKRTRAAFDQYVKCETEVKLASRSFKSADLSAFERVSQMLFGPILHSLEQEVEAGTLVPRHGPGKTADKLIGNQKFNLRTWTQRLERNFAPLADYVIPNFGFHMDLSACELRDPGHEQPVKVVCVPKTLKAPRIIAMEPAHMQYVQQALLERFVSLLESNNLVRHFIGFTDQAPNRSLAQLGSKYGHLATLDLSEASDRVALRLVTRLLRQYPSLMRMVMACRSQMASVPGHPDIRLAKFASMGSALCFPIEAMVFLTIVFCGIQKQVGPLTFAKINKFRKSVRVYGDDIVVPTHYALTTVCELQNFGLVVNTRKSFWTGKFRESCGGDFYAGVPVKPVRLTRMPPISSRNADEFISFVSHRNQLYEAGLWTTARYLDDYIETISPFPVVSRDSPALGRWSFLKQLSEERWDPFLQRWLVRARVVSSRIPVSKLSGTGALLKFFLKRGDEPIFSKDHLERSGRPRSVDTRLRWSPST